MELSDIRIRANVHRSGSIEENFVKRNKDGHKAYLTKIINEAKMLISMENPKNKVKVTAYLKTVCDRKYVINNLDNEILALFTRDEIEAEIITSIFVCVFLCVSLSRDDDNPRN